MDIATINALFLSRVRASPSKVALYFKKGRAWQPVTYAAFRDATDDTFHGLRALGVDPGDRVALLSENRPEWAYADLAILGIGAVNVPIYFTSTPKQIAYILARSGARVIFCSTEEQRKKVEEIRAETGLRAIISFDDVAPNEATGLSSLSDLRGRGRERRAKDPDQYERTALAVRPDAVASIIFTSGTTGDPKGAILTHTNFVSNVLAVSEVVPIGETDRCLSFLPLCHVFERTGGYYAMIHTGAEIAYAESIQKVVENFPEVRPTVCLSVPRVYEKIYAKVMSKVEAGSRAKKKLFEWAVKVGRRVADASRKGAKVPPELAAQHHLAMMVFGKLHAMVGGRMRFFVSGGAPLSPAIASFFEAAGLPIYEGYGLTETSPVITVNTPGHFKVGTVGRALPGVRVRIAPEDGEILAKGPSIMRGYHENPQATAEAIDKDGWFHTGDIGMFDDEGFLRITDRKKDLLKTSGGKYVAPQNVENLLKTDRYISQAVCVGDRQPYVGALVVPNFENLEPWARENGIEFKSRPELVAHDRVKAFLMERVNQLQKEQLARYEQVKRIELLSRELTEAEGELTPTQKVKRKVVLERYKDAVDRIFEGAAQAAGA